MSSIANTFQQLLQNLSELSSINENTSQTDSSISSEDALFDETQDADNIDGYNGKSQYTGGLSYEQLEAYTVQKQIDDLKTSFITSCVELLSSGTISVENFNSINSLLNGELNQDTISSLEEIITSASLETIEQTAVLTSSDDISSFLSSLSASQYINIIEQTGGIEEISSIQQNDNGTFVVNTSSDVTVAVYPSGTYVTSYDNQAQTGFEVYNEQGQLTASSYVNHQNNNSVVQKTVTYDEQGASTVTISDSTQPNTVNIIEKSAEGEIQSFTVKDTKSQTSQTVYDSSTGFSESANIQAYTGGDAELASYYEQLNALKEEQGVVQEDLTSQLGVYDTTSQEMTLTLASIDGEIDEGNSNLDSANVDLSNAVENVDTAQSEASAAQAEVETSSDNLSTSESNLDDAISDTVNAQSTESAAQSTNQNCLNAESQAQSETDTASGNLDTAISNTNSAQNTSNAANSSYNTEISETQSAFSVLNQKNSEVAAAQSSYNSACAQSSNDKSIWGKIKSAISSAFSKLKSAITGRDKAQADYEKQQAEEEKARVVSEDAESALEERIEEQTDAQNVLEAAEVVLARATGEREVSDQEYADALLQLANAMVAQNSAEGEYNSAFTQFMSAYNYQVDANNNLCDAQGKQISCSEIVSQLETFVNGLNSQRTETETSYNNTLNTTIQVINGDQTKISDLGVQITELQQTIEQEEERIALEEQMLAQLALEQGALLAEENGAGIIDDIAALFGGGYDNTADAIASKRELLEKALESGSDDDIQAAYVALYGNKEVIDEDGNSIKVSEMNSSELKSYIAGEKTSAVSAAKLYEQVANGTFSCNGQTITSDDLAQILINQAEDLLEDMTDAVDGQGIISKAIGACNNLFGIGTSEAEATAAIEQLTNVIAQMKNCTDPTQLAALYKSATGSSFDLTELVNAYTYDQVSNNKTSAVTSSTSQNDISQWVNEQSANTNGDKSLVSSLYNTNANESIQDYIQTQQTATDAVIGTVTAVATSVATEAIMGLSALAAIPTGGASIVAGIAVSAAVGAAINTGLNAVNSIYDGNDDGTLDFNYTLKDLAIDSATGALAGVASQAATVVNTQVASAAGKALSSAAGETFMETTTGCALKYGTKLAGAAAEGMIDGSISSAGSYMLDVAAGDSEFSWEQLGKTTVQGAGIGALTNVGITVVSDAVSGAASKLKAGSEADDYVDDIYYKLDDGNNETLLLQEHNNIILEYDPATGTYVDRDILQNSQGQAAAASNSTAETVSTERIYAKERIAQGNLSDSEHVTLYNDEYNRIRQRGAYKVDYGSTSFEDSIEAVQKAIDPNDIDGLFHDDTLVISNGYWSQRQVKNGFDSSKIAERVSVNAKASAEMINELDEFITTGTYIDASGNTVQVSNLVPASYKTPSNVSNWSDMQDPLTFYFSGEVNEETYEAIATITGRHARGTVANANSTKSWISNIETNPTETMVKNLADELEAYSPTLAANLLSDFARHGNQASSGQYTAYKNILQYFKDAAGQ